MIKMYSYNNDKGSVWMIIITNNPKVRDEIKGYEIIYNQISYLDVLKKVRDKVHIGHKLLTHPLSGSVKPNETPYKSIAVSKNSGDLDLDSLMIIEKSIETTQKFFRNPKVPNYKQNILEDFQLIDKGLIQKALS